MTKNLLTTATVCMFLIGCAGMKVVHPNDQNKNAGTKALDLSGGKVSLVDTYTCKILASNGKWVSAVEKSEDAARTEAVAKCRDTTVVSFCEAKKVKCVKN